MKDLTREQIGAITRSIELGRTLQQDHPEIAQLYMDGKSHPQIMKELDLTRTYGVTERVALAAISRAINGYEGGVDRGYYDGLIAEISELKRLSRAHWVESGKETHKQRIGIHAMTREQKQKLGRRLHENKIGVHAMSLEQRQEVGRNSGRQNYEKRIGMYAQTPEEKKRNCIKAGKITGRKLHEEGRGIHALTREQHQENARAGVINRGLVPWSEEETKTAYELSLLPEYSRGSRVAAGKIAGALNKKYHQNSPTRESHEVTCKLSYYRKSLENKIE